MRITRKQFLALGASSAAVAWAAPGQGQLIQTTSEWDQRQFRRIVTRPGRYRQVYDITRIGDGVFLNNVKNSVNGLQFGFAIDPREINLIAALHGNANLLNMDDAMWKKYRLGEFAEVTDPETHGPAVRNIFYPRPPGPVSRQLESDESTYQDRSIQGLMKRGVSFLLCHTATEEQSRKLKKRFGLADSPETIANDLLTHKIPGSVAVPSMVATIALLQVEYRFSYITVA